MQVDDPGIGTSAVIQLIVPRGHGFRWDCQLWVSGRKKDSNRDGGGKSVSSLLHVPPTLSIPIPHMHAQTHIHKAMSCTNMAHEWWMSEKRTAMEQMCNKNLIVRFNHLS